VATPVIEKNVTESLEAVVLTRSSSQPQSLYKAAATLFEFKLTKILIDKMEKNKSFDIDDYKREIYDALVKSYNTDKDIFESYGERSQVILLKTQACNKINSLSRETMMNNPLTRRRRIIAVTRLKIMKMYDYGHLEEIKVHRDDQNHTFRKGDFKRLRLQDIEDILLLLVQQKLTNLTIDE
nr:hypothetical protein [Tanacetum cinerariifolium]